MGEKGPEREREREIAGRVWGWSQGSEKLGRFSVGHSVAPHALSDHGLAARGSQTGKSRRGDSQKHVPAN